VNSCRPDDRQPRRGPDHVGRLCSLERASGGNYMFL
jgi:hypothetical protein